MQKKVIRSRFIAFLLIALAFACSGSDDSAPNPDPSDGEQQENPLSTELQLVLEDMTQPHEGKPKGVLDTDGWGTNPRVGYGNTPPDGWNAVLPWGQVYTDEQGNESTNTRFQIRNLQLWYLSKTDDSWKKWSSSSDISGANYAEDFQNDTNIPADIRDENGNGGGISSTLIEGYNFHFWDNTGRVVIDPDDIAGIWASLESRLIVNDSNEPDDRSEARLMMSAGADYWENTTVQWDQWKTNGDIFIGRFRYLTSEWQTFHAHTLTETQLKDNPPPLN